MTTRRMAGARSSDRRRRVLYSATQESEPATSTARTAELRKARRPTAVYGNRVERRLNGRWFSLVPIRRKSFLIAAGSWLAVTLLLCLLHVAAVSWTPLASHESVARPFLLYRIDSFGSWVMVASLAAATGASLLIYQLRRYRLDDYRGQYRLWRTVLIVCGLASVNHLVSLIDWLGSILELVFGSRIGLSGPDWVRMTVTLAIAILTLRVLADIRRSRLALGSIATSAMIVMIPELVRWHVLTFETVGLLGVTAAPLVASAALMIGLTAYLRVLYREVHQMEDQFSIRRKLSKFKFQIFTPRQSSESPGRESDADEPESASSKRRPRRTSIKTASETSAADDDTVGNERSVAGIESGDKVETDRGDRTSRWKSLFGLRKMAPKIRSAATSNDVADAQPDGESDDGKSQHTVESQRPSRSDNTTAGPKSESGSADNQHSDDARSETAPKRRFLRRRSKAAVTDSDSDAAEDSESPARRASVPNVGKSDASETEMGPGGNEKPRRRFGLGLLAHKKSAAPEPESEIDDPDVPSRPDSAGASSRSDSGKAANGGSGQSADRESVQDDVIDPDSIDWESLNKSERRRLRKQIKRQDQAA